MLSLLADDVAYQNVPQPTMHGRNAARRLLAPIIRETTAIEFILLNLAVSEDGSTVLTERIDRLHYPGGIVELPLMGVFVVHNGVITEWRDYADSATVAREFSKAGAKLVLDPE